MILIQVKNRQQSKSFLQTLLIPHVVEYVKYLQKILYAKIIFIYGSTLNQKGFT